MMKPDATNDEFFVYSITWAKGGEMKEYSVTVKHRADEAIAKAASVFAKNSDTNSAYLGVRTNAEVAAQAPVVVILEVDGEGNIDGPGVESEL